MIELKNVGNMSRDELEEFACNLDSENKKLQEELRAVKSDNKDLIDVIIKLNMRMFLGY